MQYNELLDITKDRLQNNDYYPSYELLHPIAIRHVVPQVESALAGRVLDKSEHAVGTEAQRRFLAAQRVQGVIHGVMIFGTFGKEEPFRCLPWLVSPEIAGDRNVVWHSDTAREFLHLQCGYQLATRPMTSGAYTLSFENRPTMIVSEGNFPPQHKQAVREVAEQLADTTVWLFEENPRGAECVTD